VTAALARVTAEVGVAGIDTDRLYPLALQQDLAKLLPGRRPCAVITSEFGHDGFLLEVDQAGAAVAVALGA
jgi:homoserine O-acetyltransferase